MSSYMRKSAGEVIYGGPIGAGLAQVNPTQNTWYTCLDTVSKVRIAWVWCKCSTAEDIQVRLTVDGVAHIITKAPAVAGTDYFIYLGIDSTGVLWLITSVGVYLLYQSSPMDAISFKAEIRKTSTLGGCTLSEAVLYEIA